MYLYLSGYLISLVGRIGNSTNISTLKYLRVQLRSRMGLGIRKLRLHMNPPKQSPNPNKANKRGCRTSCRKEAHPHRHGKSKLFWRPFQNFIIRIGKQNSPDFIFLAYSNLIHIGAATYGWSRARTCGETIAALQHPTTFEKNFSSILPRTKR